MTDGLFNIAQDSGGNLGVSRQRDRPGPCLDPPRVPPLVSPDLIALLFKEILNVAPLRILHTYMYTLPYNSMSRVGYTFLELCDGQCRGSFQAFAGAVVALSCGGG